MARDRILQIYRGTTAQNDAFTGAQGELTMDTARKEIRIHDGSTAGGNVVGLTPGFIAPFAGSTAPAGWLVCDGSAVSRTTYAKLFAVIGTTYGEGDGNSTFNLPNQSPTHRVIEFQEPTAANNYTWYRLYDDGWAEQGGTMSYANAEVIKTIVLPTEMANSNYALQLTRKDGSSPANDTGYKFQQYNSKTTTGFSFWWTTNNRQVGIDWNAFGASARGATQQNIMCIKY